MKPEPKLSPEINNYIDRARLANEERDRIWQTAYAEGKAQTERVAEKRLEAEFERGRARGFDEGEIHGREQGRFEASMRILPLVAVLKNRAGLTTSQRRQVDLLMGEIRRESKRMRRPDWVARILACLLILAFVACALVMGR